MASVRKYVFKDFTVPIILYHASISEREKYKNKTYHPISSNSHISPTGNKAKHYLK